jgi:chromosomal replication initiation ATPase DnaA
VKHHQKTFGELKSREDRRRRQRRREENRARRTLMPVMVAVCETYRVTPDDIISRSVHRDIVAARNIVVYLGWERCKIGTTVLGSILCKHQTHVSKQLTKLRTEIAKEDSFHRQVAAVLRRVRSIELSLQKRERATA